MDSQRIYSYSKGAGKSLIAFALFALPFLVTSFPDVANLTLGAALTMGLNYLKFHYLSEE